METLKLIQGQPLLIIVALFVLLTVKVMLMFFVKMLLDNVSQCVAMSLCSLIGVYCQGATPDSGALVYIMNWDRVIPCQIIRGLAPTTLDFAHFYIISRHW